ncbi:MAG: SulP family inorganic anion transporter [Pirellulales bacterium]|nr:SulP family inorganic anion transporter [Pirellulales bacterium]
MVDQSMTVPRGDAQGFGKYFRQDFLSGFLVFLIALPLCLGISLASGFPPLAGIFAAIIGSILTTFISNSEMTIKGPAAGLIVIAIGCIEEFGGDGMTGGFTAADMSAYKMTLAVGVAAAVLQILFGIFRAGVLGEFFPVSAVHGMLAAIGIIIISKQVPVALGVEAKGDPLDLLGRIPEFIMEANPAIALIGGISLIVMFVWPLIRGRLGFLKVVPSPLIVLAVVVPMGWGFDLLHDHSYFLQGHKYQLGEQYLVRMPSRMFGMFDEIAFPDFSALKLPVAWKWVMMFFIVGSLESLLSAKAIDLIDPWRRKTSMDRDMAAVGVANLAAAMVGGLPIISEIVRSRANIDNGARTRFADMWHGVFLLACVALIPTVLHMIPLAALAAMLIYTGSRLAHPSEFMHVYHIGREQLVIFVTTIIAVLATDLLIGIAVGIAMKMFIHILNGVPIGSLFKPYLDVTDVDESTCMISAHHSAVFSNWIPFRREIEHIGFVKRKNLIVDLSETKFVDHSVMDKLITMQRDFEQEGLSLEITGLETHRGLSDHEAAARKRGVARVRRVTVTTDAKLERWLEDEFVQRGATGYTVIPCSGAGRRLIAGGEPPVNSQMRIEVICTNEVCERILAFLRKEVQPEHHVTACAEVVEVVRLGQFLSDSNGYTNGSLSQNGSSNGHAKTAEVIQQC